MFGKVPATVSIVFIAAIARSCYSLAEPVAVMVGPDTALATPYDTGNKVSLAGNGRELLHTLDAEDTKMQMPRRTLHGKPRALLQGKSGECYSYGTAPSCAASCDDCTNDGSLCANGNYQTGAACWTGYKVQCCWP